MNELEVFGWMILLPKGCPKVYVNCDEQFAWRAALGWPGTADIDWYKQQGAIAIKVKITQANSTK